MGDYEKKTIEEALTETTNKINEKEREIEKLKIIRSLLEDKVKIYEDYDYDGLPF